jgi:DNA-binding MarR family transcriptional regulator
VSGYWKAPRALVRLLTSRRVTPNEYMLLHFLAESGADRAGGVDTSNAFLADALNVSVKTIGRALRGLRARGLIEFDDHRGAIFIVRTTAALAALEREPETPEGTREAAGDRTRGDVAMSQSVSELTWDTRPFSCPPNLHQSGDRSAINLGQPTFSRTPLPRPRPRPRLRIKLRTDHHRPLRFARGSGRSALRSRSQRSESPWRPFSSHARVLAGGCR